MPKSNHTILLADEDDAARAFLAENVARHIFRLLWPNGLCGRPRDRAVFTAVGSGSPAGHITVRVRRAS